MIILLTPEKMITSTPREQWEELSGCHVTLFTSASEQYASYLRHHLHGIFEKIEFFSDYPNNDTVEIKLLEYAKSHDVKNIIPMTEADVLRCARVKEKLKMDGMSYADAVKFRDKIVMKELARQSGINVPSFRRIRHSADLMEFIEEVGYPVIIKPISGRGSLNTLSIADESSLMKILNTGLISNTSRYTDLLAEAFMDAPIYHIDGLQLNKKVEVMSVSRYINNCLTFVSGSFLGSYTLEVENPLRIKLDNFANNLIQNVFPLHRNSLFHIEVFVDENDAISLCEIACRIGGNGINDEVKMQQGIDIKMEFIKSECGLHANNSLNRGDIHPVAGRLLIPPKEARLISFPDQCDIPGVIRYHVRGKAGQDYKKMAMSNDEIANFLMVGGNENEMCEKIAALSCWFNEQVIWG